MKLGVKMNIDVVENKGKLTEGKIAELFGEAFSKNYVTVYNMFADSANVKLSHWNSEYDERFPGLKEDCTDPDSEYMKFMRKKYQAVAQQINKRYKKAMNRGLIKSQLTISEYCVPTMQYTVGGNLNFTANVMATLKPLV